jgi:hypothetical protein
MMPCHADLLAATPKCQACGAPMRCDHQRSWWWCSSTVHAGQKTLRYWTNLVRQQDGD